MVLQRTGSISLWWQHSGEQALNINQAAQWNRGVGDLVPRNVSVGELTPPLSAVGWHRHRDDASAHLDTSGSWIGCPWGHELRTASPAHHQLERAELCTSTGQDSRIDPGGGSTGKPAQGHVQGRAGPDTPLLGGGLGRKLGRYALHPPSTSSLPPEVVRKAGPRFMTAGQLVPPPH